MDGTATRMWAVAGALLLVGAVACGDDDGGDGAGPGDVFGEEAPSDDAGSGPSGEIDLCSLLDEAEVEAQFGERGAVAEGTPEFGCTWEVGDQTVAGTGTVSLRRFSPVAGETIEEALATYRDIANDPVDVEGIGDEAFFEHELSDPLDQSTSRLTFTTGDLLLNLEANFFGVDVDGPQEQEKLVTLAEHVLERL